MVSSVLFYTQTCVINFLFCEHSNLFIQILDHLLLSFVVYLQDIFHALLIVFEKILFGCFGYPIILCYLNPLIFKFAYLFFQLAYFFRQFWVYEIPTFYGHRLLIRNILLFQFLVRLYSLNYCERWYFDNKIQMDFNQKQIIGVYIFITQIFITFLNILSNFFKSRYIQFRFIKNSMRILKPLLLIVLISTTLAQECGPGGIVCSSGTCHFPNYIQGCLTYLSSTACFDCQYNYVKNGNICTYSPPTDNSDCCKAYVHPSGQCSQCAKGLALVQGKCLDRKVAGCLVKSKTGTCLNCALQYVLFGGQCLKKIAGCNKYKGTGQCQACDDKYQYVNSYCIPRIYVQENCKYPWVNQTGTCFIPGCKDANDFGCSACQGGFRLLPDGSCQKGTIEGCQLYSPDGFCQTCKKPFFIESPTGFCLSLGCLTVNQQGKCTACDSKRGFDLTNDGYCKIGSCLVTNGQECLVCQKGFLQVYGRCEKQDFKKLCTVCARNFYLTETGECKPKQPGCLKYLRYKCTECESNLYLNRDSQCIARQKGCIYKDGLCSDCINPFKRARDFRCLIEGCTQYNEIGCNACYKPYVLSKFGTCTYENCLQVQDGKCLSCIEGYAISHEGYCYLTDPFCKAYNFEGKCIQCKLGYYADKSASGLKCRQQKFGCNYVDGRCVSCRAPFQYNSNEQSCFIDGCLKYFLGGCQECAATYDLRYNSCKLPFCLVSRKGNCVECDPNYIHKSDGTCVNKDEFCWKYDDSGNCVQCAPEYFLSKLTQKCKPREPGCQYNDQDRCFACDKPFYFDGVRCQIYGCMKLNFKGCESCFYPRQVTKFGLCNVVNCDRMQKDKCVACKAGYIIGFDGSCQVQDPKCLVYCDKPGCQCQKCVKGYRVDQTGLCQYADEHCWDFSEQGHCTNCDRLYFLNIHNKCELKDSNCAAYSGGRCIQCKNYFYLHRGLCYPNAKGCIKQRNIKKCEKCESGYKLQQNICTPEITKLSWDSVNMDFWSGESDQSIDISKEVFSRGKTNKYNLDGAINKGKAKIVYSSIVSGRKSLQVDDYTETNGWTPLNSGKGQFIGIVLQKMQTFYAVDIRYISGNGMIRFAIEQSDNGINYRRVQEFNFPKWIPGTVQTFYYTPVHSKAIRLVVLQGLPNVKVQFYYSNGEIAYPNADKIDSYLANETEQTIYQSLRGEIFQTKQGCVDKDLCWFGLQLCEAKSIIGFSLLPNKNSKGTIEAVSIKYSLDGVKFVCYNDCRETSMAEGVYNFNPRVSALKLRVSPIKWKGQPSYSVSFEY